MIDVTMVVATYGEDSWRVVGDRAAAYTAVQQGTPLIRLHDASMTLAQVRNAALGAVDTEYVCFVDADDTLDEGYFDRVAGADIIVTPLDGDFPTVNQHPHECQPTCLLAGNYIHIGAIARTDLLRSLGGFREHPIYEDWDLWLRCYHAGATFENSPGPSYRTRVFGSGGRNLRLPVSARRRVREHIIRTAGSEQLPLDRSTR